MSKKKTKTMLVRKEIPNATRMGAIESKNLPLKMSKKQKSDKSIYDFCLYEPGFYFAYGDRKDGSYFGMPQSADGHILVVGGSGSGKSSGIAKPTLETWNGAICATDIKGELSACYEHLLQKGFVTRPYILFDPTKDDVTYDPFWLLRQEGEDDLVSNIQEIAYAIVPDLPEDIQPFWVESERAVLAAALLYYYQLGSNFSDAMCMIAKEPLSSTCKKLVTYDDDKLKIFLGDVAQQRYEVLASIDRGLRNKIMSFAVDPYISHALSGESEGGCCFNWDDLREYNIFVRVPANRIEQWSSFVNLMYSQLIRYLERRPEQYSVAGKENIKTLLLMDEFARFGKLNHITEALATLRSKGVNICLMVQSLAQIDQIYGEKERRTILDNCQYTAVLRVNDADTQEYFSKLIGTRMQLRHSASIQLSKKGKPKGYSIQISEVQDRLICPHELATLEDVLLITPKGIFQVEKHAVHCNPTICAE